MLICFVRSIKDGRKSPGSIRPLGTPRKILGIPTGTGKIIQGERHALLPLLARSRRRRTHSLRRRETTHRLHVRRLGKLVVMLEAITYEDNDSYQSRYVNFPKFITIVIKHWVENPNHPHLPPHPGIPVESVMAPMPPPPLDQPMPLVYSPPPSYPPPHVPHYTPPNSPEMPYAMHWDAVYAPYGRHDPPPGFPSAPQPPVVPSPPRPVAPPPSPARPRRTARMRTTNPNIGSPFRFVIPSPVHAEAGSPNDHFGSGAEAW